MTDSKKLQATYRSILTDTLPYEVPVIFSNEKLFFSLIAPPRDDKVHKEFEKIVRLRSSGATPYQYRIQKDQGRGATDLAIMHPTLQLEFALFYKQYSQSILDYCKKSEFSLRRPASISSTFSKVPLAKSATVKVGRPQLSPDDVEVEVDISHWASHFAYARYNLLGKFYDSEEFLRLEKRFSRLRTLDVSKCFFNIYTHTITWAVKSRDFAKSHRNAYSFEGRFDNLMQKVNRNETNGILVGAEVSRIFAEIIFQEIDRSIFESLNDKQHEWDYAIRRYVDDYLIFANSENELDNIERIISDKLLEYKLFLNSAKTKTYMRPFVSEITLARSEIKAALRDLRPALLRVASCSDPSELRDSRRCVRDCVAKVRLSVARYNVGFHTISGWLLSSLRRTLEDVIANSGKLDSEERREIFTDAIIALLRAVFHICALDTRVRTTYSLCQIIADLQPYRHKVDAESYDRIIHVISEELQSIIKILDARRNFSDTSQESIELYNILICGAKFLGADFVGSASIKSTLCGLMEEATLRYFAYITVKFCFLRNDKMFSKELEDLNTKAEDRLSKAVDKIKDDTELFMLFCDYISAPDVEPKQKRKMLNDIMGGDSSKKTVDLLGNYIGFVDWSGLQIEHLLARKELRPVYAWD